MFDNHKAMQSLDAHLRSKVYWQTLRSSTLHLCIIGINVVWAVVYITLIYLDRHGLWSAMVTLFMVILWYPFEWIKPRRRLAAAFLKMNIRPSHCAYCEYDLRGSPGDTCTECGTRLAPQPTAGASKP